MTDEPLDLAPIIDRDYAFGDLGPYGRYSLAAHDRRALLAEVKRLRAQLAEAGEYAADLLARAPALIQADCATAWDEGYRNGYSIGYNDSPAALTNYQNPYRTQPEETP